MPATPRKVAIVTGSATGVGAACAILLAEHGCNVVINYTRSVKEAEETAAACRAKGAETIVFQGDVSDDAACQAMAKAAFDQWGRIDYLINNAARTKFNPYKNLDGVSKQDFLDIYAVNVVGPYQMVRAVTPYMKRQGFGAIVNDSSIGGVTGIASSIPYAASKAALNLMTKSLAHVLAPEIRINTVVPGMIQTRWLKGGMGDEQYEAMIKTQGAQLPLKKVARPEDIAEVLVWFLESAHLVTGESLIVDSGIHLGTLPAYSSGDKY
jgi:3-oxoacyl-[acyl-carrier protein] reductase